MKLNEITQEDVVAQAHKWIDENVGDKTDMALNIKSNLSVVEHDGKVFAQTVYDPEGFDDVVLNGNGKPWVPPPFLLSVPYAIYFKNYDWSNAHWNNCFSRQYFLLDGTIGDFKRLSQNLIPHISGEVNLSIQVEDDRISNLTEGLNLVVDRIEEVSVTVHASNQEFTVVVYDGGLILYELDGVKPISDIFELQNWLVDNGYDNLV